MRSFRSSWGLLSFISVCLLFCSCDKKKNDSATAASSSPGVFDPLKNVKDAPPFIQKAARATVRITTIDGVGTGFMVSDTGTLATNNHVVGPENCPFDGCFVELDFNYAKENPWEKAKEYFLEPLESYSDLDLALFQVYQVDKEGEPSDPLNNVPFIPFKKGARPQRGDKVWTVGNPHGALLKWSQGEIYSFRGDWFESTLCVLGGASGSPVFNKSGELVGIVHRGRDIGDQLFHLNAAQCVGIFSDVNVLGNFNERAAKEETEFEAADFLTLEELAEGEDGKMSIGMLMMSHISEFDLTVEGKESKVLLPNLLLEACESEIDSEEALKNPDFAYSHCEMGMELVNCNNPNVGKGYRSCPAEPQQKKWQKVFSKIAALEEKKNQDALDWSVVAPAVFAPSKAEAQKEARRRLLEHVTKHPVENESRILLAVVQSSTNRGDLNWRGKDYLREFQNYAQIPFYDRNYLDIGLAFDELVGGKLLTPQEIESFSSTFIADTRIPVFPKMLVEAMAHQGLSPVRH